MENEPNKKDKVLTERFIFIIIIVLLIIAAAFIFFNLIASNNNQAITYQAKISKLETDIFNLQNLRQSAITCPKPVSLPCGAASSSQETIAPKCSLFTYTDWSTCSADGNQTRTVTSQSPDGCIGGSPYLHKTCTPPPVPCTSFTYSSWDICTDGVQRRTIDSQSPPGCIGGTADLTRSCTI